MHRAIGAVSLADVKEERETASLLCGSLDRAAVPPGNSGGWAKEQGMPGFVLDSSPLDPVGTRQTTIYVGRCSYTAETSARQ